MRRASKRGTIALMEQQLILRFVDPSSRLRAELARVAFSLGHHAEVYSTTDELIDHLPETGILIVRDDRQTGGVPEVMRRLAEAGQWLPMIATDMDPSTRRIVAAIKSGALDYLPLPLDLQRFTNSLEKIAAEVAAHGQARRRMIEAQSRISHLSMREREVLQWLAAGSSNKVIARELEISPRTVEIHRANMMAKLGAKHAAEAVRLQIEADMTGAAA